RHTRSYGDWSSDVCSSDLGAVLQLAEEMDRELSGLGLLQLIERKCRVSGQPPSPAGPGIEQVWARESEHEDRQVAEPRGQQLDQDRKSVVGPMHVFEHQHRRPVTGNRFDEA